MIFPPMVIFTSVYLYFESSWDPFVLFIHFMILTWKSRQNSAIHMTIIYLLIYFLLKKQTKNPNKTKQTPQNKQKTPNQNKHKQNQKVGGGLKSLQTNAHSCIYISVINNTFTHASL